MDKFLGHEIANPAERAEYLNNNCFGREEKSYMKQFEPEVLAKLKDDLAVTAIEIDSIETEKKAVMDGFKEQLKPLEEDKKALLKKIQQKAELVVENAYKFVYPEERMVGYYSREGNLIEARPMRPEDGQMTILMPQTGTEV